MSTAETERWTDLPELETSRTKSLRCYRQRLAKDRLAGRRRRVESRADDSEGAADLRLPEAQVPKPSCGRLER